jgi:hypothetical protein
VPASLLKTLLALLLLSAQAGVARANDSRLAVQSLRCAAIFSIFSQKSGLDESVQNSVKTAIPFFEKIYLKEFTSDPLDLSRQLGDRMAQTKSGLVEELKTRRPYLEEEGVVCGAWAEGLIDQKLDGFFTPVYPKVLSPQARSKYTEFSRNAWGP